MLFKDYLKDHRVYNRNLIDVHSGWEIPRESFEEFYEAEVVKTEYNWRGEEVVYVDDSGLEFFSCGMRLKMIPGDSKTLRELLEELKDQNLAFSLRNENHGHGHILSTDYNDLHERFSHCLDAKVESYRILPCKDNWYHDNYCLVILKDFYEEDLYVKDK